MQANRTLPSAERMGILLASILLTFTLTRLINSPRLTLTIALPGFYFAYPLTLGTGMTLLAGALSITGMTWLTEEFHTRKVTVEHFMLPTLTTLALGSFLQLVSSSVWWVGVSLSAFILLGVFLAEYITMEPSAPQYGFARAGLTAIAYTLFLITTTALRFSGMRMFLLVPIIFLVSAVISLRILHLDGEDRWDFPWAIGIGIISMQIGAGLHYWQISPLQYGLALTGPLYALTVLSASLAENIPLQRAAVSPAILLGLVWGVAFFVQ